MNQKPAGGSPSGIPSQNSGKFISHLLGLDNTTVARAPRTGGLKRNCTFIFCLLFVGSMIWLFVINFVRPNDRHFDRPPVSSRSATGGSDRQLVPVERKAGPEHPAQRSTADVFPAPNAGRQDGFLQPSVSIAGALHHKKAAGSRQTHSAAREQATQTTLITRTGSGVARVRTIVDR